MKKTILSIVLFSFAMASGYAQQKLSVPNDTRSISFSEDNVILKKITGEESAYSLAEVGILVFNEEDIPMEINNPSVASDLFVYTTADGKFAVKSDETVQSLTLFDLSGKTLRKISDSVIEAQDLERGIYILKIETENGVKTKKVVKQ